MNTKIIIPAAALIILVSGVLFVIKPQRKSERINSVDKPTQIVTPIPISGFTTLKVMGFTVQLPRDYGVEGESPYVKFKRGENFIAVVRNGSVFDSLDEDLADYDAKNKIESTSDKKKLEINGYQAISRLELRDVLQKAYYIYVGDYVYIFSTKSEKLYSDLDQVAQSFRYTPN